MGNTGSVYSMQFANKLDAYIKQRIDVFAFIVAQHLFMSKPTHAQIDSSVVDKSVQLEFLADSEKERGSIKRVETNYVRYENNDIASRLRAQRLERAKQGVMEYGIPFDPERPVGNTMYILPQQMAVEDISQAVLNDIFTGSNIMPAVGSEIPAVLKKEKWSKLDLPLIAHAYGYTTPESALEKIRTYFSRQADRD